MPDMVDLVKEKHCKVDNSIYARYKVFNALGREKVPSDLFPIDIKRADQIILDG